MPKSTRNSILLIGNIYFFNKTLDDTTEIFAEFFLDIMSRNIPNKTITCNDKDAPWMTSEIKTAIKRNVRAHRKWVSRGRLPEDRDNIRWVQNKTNKLIKAAKQNSFRNLRIKLSNYDLNRFGQRLNFPQKATFSDYFSNLCSLNHTSSTIPSLNLKTHSGLQIIDTSEEKISALILMAFL